MRPNVLTSVLILVWAQVAVSSNLGTYGELFTIIEIDIREVIAHRLQVLESSDQLSRYKKEAIGRMTRQVVQPTPVNLSTTTKPRVFYIDPSITIIHDIVTPDGLLVAKSGTVVNPFTHVSYKKTLFFFNAEDSRQINWVKAHYADYEYVKFILTGGDIRDAARSLGRIYFDQAGRLSEQLQLKHVPSVVTQEGLRWKIREVGVNEI